MAVSMTGFANHSLLLFEQAGEQCIIDIEIKTFNSRFFEATCKLPNALSALEGRVLSSLKDGLARGRVYCTVRVIGAGAPFERLSFSSLRVQEYLDAAAQLRSDFSLSGELSVRDVITLPSVFASDRVALSDDIVERFIDGVATAVAMTQESRQREGAHLRVDIMERIELLSGLITKVSAVFESVMNQARENLADLQQKGQSGDAEAAALVSERYVALDKRDVNEEIVRFSAHLSAIKEVLEGSGLERGRKLDFILQELLRETNTIMSKSTDYTLSAHAVDIKVELEKIREQVQNIV
jgi:uncharacterized protein (TIGR00255 family)